MLVIAIHPASALHPRLLPINDQPSTINGSQTCELSNLRTFELIFRSTINNQPSTFDPGPDLP